MAGLCALATMLFGWMFYFFYWRHRHQFNSEGRYFDPAQTVVYDVDSIGLIVPTLAGLLLTLAFLALWWRMRVR